MTMNYEALKASVDFCDNHGVEIPLDLLAEIAMTIKTEAYYLRVLTRAVRDLYNERITEDDFLGTMTRLLDEQIVRAWREGMRANGIEPDDTKWTDEIRAIQDSEFSYLQGFIDAILKASADKTPIDPLLSRAELWASRYSDVVSRAQVATAPKDLLFVWRYGDTIEHCETCAEMASLGAKPATFWQDKQAEGIYPQSPQLACSGFNCDCEIVAVDE